MRSCGDVVKKVQSTVVMARAHRQWRVFELQMPREQEGSFEPEIVKKRQMVLNGYPYNKIWALYVLGMNYETIALFNFGQCW